MSNRPFLLQTEVMKKLSSSPKNNVDILNSAFPNPFALFFGLIMCTVSNMVLQSRGVK